MRAIDYFERYQAAEDKTKAILDIGREFVAEIEKICESRKCATSAAVIAVFQEQEKKWEAFRAMVDPKPAVFVQFVKHYDPGFYGRTKKMAEDEERQRRRQNKAVEGRLKVLGLL